MNRLDLVRKIAFESRMLMKDIASELGVSPQSFYRTLRTSISLDKFVDIAHICGYRVVVVDKDNRKITEVE